jgi:hypothetical protein
MKFLEYLERAFVVRGCILCDTPLDYNRELPICDECKSHLVDQLDLLCPKCGYDSEYCTCIPKRTEGKIDFLTFCSFYKSEFGNPANGIVYKLKRDYNREVIDFCAKQMRKKTVKEFSKQNMSYKDYIVTYPPRRKDGVIDYGYDHAQLLAKRYAHPPPITLSDRVSTTEEVLIPPENTKASPVTKTQRKADTTGV